jgi:DNA-binding beta-propeller fold protein YncE
VCSNAVVNAQFDCTANPVANGAAALSPYNGITVNVNDTANLTTPDAATSATQPAPVVRNLVVNDDLTITVNYADPLDDAVNGRTYGSPANTVQYTATGGLGDPTINGSYVFTITSPFPTGITCTTGTNPNANQFDCFANPATVSGGPGAFTPTVRVDDLGNASVPTGVASGTAASVLRNLQVNAALTMNPPTPDPALNDAVDGRTYGEAPQSPPTFTASGGLPGLTFSISSGAPPNGITCQDIGGSMTCDTTSSGPVNEPGAPLTFNFTVRVDDSPSPNGLTPAGFDTFATSITVQPALTITTPVGPLVNGLVNFPYPTPPGTFNFTATGGIGAQTWVEPGATNGPCSGGSAPSGALPTGLSIAATTGALSGTPTQISTAIVGNPFLFEVCVFDTANATTPAAAALSGGSYSMFVLDQKAYVAGSTSDEVEVIHTGSNPGADPSVPGTVIPLNPGDTPTYVGISATGTSIGVVTSTSQLYVISTITDTIDTVIDLTTLSTPCTSPAHVAGARVNNANTPYLALVACAGSSSVVIIDTQTGAEVANLTVGGGVGAPYGVAIAPNGNTAYVTDNALNQFYEIDLTASPPVVSGTFAPAGMNAPTGVAVSADSGRLYVANFNSNPALDDYVLVISPPGSTTILDTINVGVGAVPESIAFDPNGTNAFVTLTGISGFVAITDGTVAPLVATAVTTAAPVFGVTVPPLPVMPAAGFRVFMTDFSNDTVIIHNSLTPFAASAVTTNPLVLSSATGPLGIVHIPIPR